MAYNLPDLNGEIGDEFMKEMEPAMAQVPYQVAVGNHEHPKCVFIVSFLTDLLSVFNFIAIFLNTFLALR